MEETLSLIVKYLVPVITTLVTTIALFKGWVFPTDRLFEKRKELSKFVYELYKISGEEQLKNLSIEYGYAAITKESILTKEQRMALINSKDPTRDIDQYRKCSNLLMIKPCPLSFEWRKSRHKIKLYRRIVIVVKSIFYFGGVYLVTLPLTFHILLPNNIYTHFMALSLLNRWLIVLYLTFTGSVIALFSLNGSSKLVLAEGLRKRHPLE